MTDFIEHPLIKPDTIERREYQVILAKRALERGNTLIVMPTALGKTIVAALVIAERLKNGGKALFLAPTKPLAVQHAKTLRSVLKIPEEQIVVFSGDVPPEKRKRLWEMARVISATPQTIENDLLSNRISLEDVRVCVFDEAHRAVGEYSYVFIAKKYMEQAKDPLILALTASPGGTQEKINLVCQNLFISNIEIKTPYDPDVRPYIHKIFVRWVEIELPPRFKEIKRLLENYIRHNLIRLKELGIVESSDIRSYTKRDYLALQEKLRAKTLEAPENKNFYEALMLVAGILKVEHGLELLETQGIHAFLQYMEKLELKGALPGSPKAIKHVLESEFVREAIKIAKELKAEGVDHPKLTKAVEIVRRFFERKPDGRVIVFVQYRDTASKLVELLSAEPGIKPVRFVGQASRMGDRGMTKRQQQLVLEKFRRGEYNVLVATSVAEEGLDIPEVDLVVFYEAVPSEIRAIQRRGRTGRKKAGEVVVLIAKGTRDEAYYWAAKAKEKKMIEALLRLRKALRLSSHKVQSGQLTIVQFVTKKPEKKLKILADIREKGSGIIHLLHDDPEVDVELCLLPVGDYLISEEVAVERKSAADFLQSIIDGRLFDQARRLKEEFKKPVIIVEGEGLYHLRDIHPNAVRGALLSLALDYGIPVLFSKNPVETASFLKILAKREQIEEDREVRLRGEKRIMTDREMQLFIVQSLPYIGPKLAKALLERFGTVERVFTASEKELASVEGIGEKRAREIRRILTKPFES